MVFTIKWAIFSIAIFDSLRPSQHQAGLHQAGPPPGWEKNSAEPVGRETWAAWGASSETRLSGRWHISSYIPYAPCMLYLPTWLGDMLGKSWHIFHTWSTWSTWVLMWIGFPTAEFSDGEHVAWKRCGWRSKPLVHYPQNELFVSSYCWLDMLWVSLSIFLLQYIPTISHYEIRLHWTHPIAVSRAVCFQVDRVLICLPQVLVDQRIISLAK